MKKKKNIFLIFLFAFLLSGIWWQFFARKYDVNYQTFGYGFRANRIANSSGEIFNHGLLDHAGEFQELYRYADARAIVIIGQDNSCLISPEKINLFNNLVEKFKSKKIEFFLMNSNPKDNREDINSFAESGKISAPILLDRSQLLAENVGFSDSQEVAVIDPSQWKVIYRGELNSELEQVLNNFPNQKTSKKLKKISECPIPYEKNDPISYNKQVAPIIREKCLNCHAKDGPYLPVLDSHDKIKSWSAMAVETILSERMPPFSADTHYGIYSNDISLSADEKRTLVRWFKQGAELDGEDTLLKREFKKRGIKQRLKEMKKVYTVSMDKEMVIPPVGTIEYKYTQLGGAAPRDMWIKAINVKTTNPRQLHHLAMMITKKPLAHYEKIAELRRLEMPDEVEEKKVDGDIYPFVLNSLQRNEFRDNPDYYRSQVWAAGREQPQIIARGGIYIFIPKDSYIVLESHHMGTGRVETEKTTIDFYEELNPLPLNQRKKLKSIFLLTFDFVIPPYAKKHKVLTREWTLKKDVQVLSYIGHLHMRGKSVEVDYVSPDSKETRKVVSIPNFYYGWHTGSGLHNVTPQVFKKGSRLRATCTFDNSPQNPNNPDPSKEVRFGQRVDRTEMCMVGVSYILN